MKIINVVGARPNFMKVAPIHRAILAYPDMLSRIVHTGQHFDAKMSGIFFDQLGLPVPDYFMGVGSGSQTAQLAQIMQAFEPILNTEKPDLVLVVGDVTSTLACALAANKAGIPLAHVEAGLRSGDRTMPEEINRLLTDSLADQLFVTEPAAVINLQKENISSEKIHLVGNVMIDSLIRYRKAALKLRTAEKSGVSPGTYVLLTLHRPANVDHAAGLRKAIDMIREVARYHPVLFPVHPRTWANLAKYGLRDTLLATKNLILLEPQGYLEFLDLTTHAGVVITDSGGIQEETTFLRVPCITLRSTTERPGTVELGTNHLLDIAQPQAVSRLTRSILAGNMKSTCIPALWDGKSADRIVAILRDVYLNSYVCEK